LIDEMIQLNLIPIIGLINSSHPSVKSDYLNIPSEMNLITFNYSSQFLQSLASITGALDFALSLIVCRNCLQK